MASSSFLRAFFSMRETYSAVTLGQTEGKAYRQSLSLLQNHRTGKRRRQLRRRFRHQNPAPPVGQQRLLGRFVRTADHPDQHTAESFPKLRQFLPVPAPGGAWRFSRSPVAAAAVIRRPFPMGPAGHGIAAAPAAYLQTGLFPFFVSPFISFAAVFPTDQRRKPV